MTAPLDFAAPKLGSGARFRKLSGALAARGASDPDALAAFIGRKKFGAARFGKLSAHGHANPDLGIYLAETAKDEQGLTLVCPECNYSGPANSFGASGASLQTQPGDLQTPAPGTGSARDGAATTVRGGNAAHALANDTWSSIGLATGTLTGRRNPVKSPVDVIVARGEDGRAVIRHRQGGGTIAQIRRDGDTWVATVDGRDLSPHSHQRTALMEAVGTYNRATAGGLRTASQPLQPAPEQTPLMQQYGIPAIRALATPTAGASDGPRMTTAGGSGDDDSGGNGLSPKGQGIYKKLIAKGFPAARALAFAKRAEAMAAKASA